MEGSSIFQSSLSKLFKLFSGQWPPHPDFKNWPEEFYKYMKTADLLPQWLSSGSTPEEFRMWLKTRLELIKTELVIEEVEKRLHEDRVDNVVLGFLSCLSFLIQSYRWGTLPVTQQERERKILEFPDQLWKPYVKISDRVGVLHRGTVFSLVACNAVYGDDDTQNENISIRFRFNSEENIAETEKYFCIMFLEMEKTFRKGLLNISKYLAQTDLAIRSPDEDECKKALAVRCEMLGELTTVVNTIAKLYRRYANETKVKSQWWSEYVESMHAWSINGIDSGSSGAEGLLFLTLDEFLDIPGECALFKSNAGKMKGIPSSYRQIVESLKIGKEYRFKKLCGSEEENPLVKCRDEIIRNLAMWRLSHAKTAVRYLKHNKTTASGIIEQIQNNGSLAAQAELQLRERARETIRCISTSRTEDNTKKTNLEQTSRGSLKNDALKYFWRIFEVLFNTG